MIKENKCDSCGKRIEDKEKVTVIIRNVEATTRIKAPDRLHLKLAEKSLGSRAFKLYCEGCLNTENYVCSGTIE